MERTPSSCMVASNKVYRPLRTADDVDDRLRYEYHPVNPGRQMMLPSSPR